jgi:ribonuclease HI
MTNALRKAVGIIRMPYVRIGGNVAFPPPFLAHLQTDGSFRAKSRSARVAYILLSADGRRTYRDTESIPHAASSTDTEWASILTGLEFAVSVNQTAIGIENDCLSVIHALIQPETPLRNAAHREIRREILGLAKHTTWTGVRWIPREENRADALLR